LADLLRWLWSGHQHQAISTGLVLATPHGGGRPELVEIQRCDCGAIRPVDGRWVRPVED
jgi:hypothetical protein